MKPAKRRKSNRIFWLASIAGFLFAAGLSLAGGNHVATSLLRGFVGWLAGMAIYWLSARLLHSLLAASAAAPAQHVNTSETGSRFDVSLPAESPHDSPQTSDFQPWIIGQADPVGEEQAAKMAQALRAIQE